MKFKRDVGVIVGGISGAIISYLLIYHCERIFPARINPFVIGALPWIGAVIGNVIAKRR